MGSEHSSEEERGSEEEEEEEEAVEKTHSAPAERRIRRKSLPYVRPKPQTPEKPQPAPPPLQRPQRTVYTLSPRKDAPENVTKRQTSPTINDVTHDDKYSLTTQPNVPPPPVDFQPKYRRPMTIPPLDIGPRVQPIQGGQRYVAQPPRNVGHFTNPQNVEFSSLLTGPVHISNQGNSVINKREHVRIFDTKPLYLGHSRTFPARNSPTYLKSDSLQGYSRPYMNGYHVNSNPYYTYRDFDRAPNYSYHLNQYPSRGIPAIQAQPVVYKKKMLPSDYPHPTQRRWSLSNRWY